MRSLWKNLRGGSGRWTRVLGPLLLGVLSCSTTGALASSASAGPPGPGVVAPPLVDAATVSANTRFALHLLSELWQSRPGDNAFVSPVSIGVALAMTLNGAGGETRAAMADALEIGDLTLEHVNRAYAAFLASRWEEAGVEISIANSLWAREGVRFRKEFFKANEDFYGARVTGLDFRDPGAVEAINAWVREETRGKITNIVDSIPAEVFLYLINSIYFKGSWRHPFDEKKTSEGDFHLLDGTVKKHPMMKNRGSFKYLEWEGFQAVSLPYGSGRVSMYVFLPGRDDRLGTFLEGLSPERWDAWMAEFTRRPGWITMPRFTLECTFDLNDVLTALGMGIAFDPDRADFSGMVAEQAWIDRVKHKTYVEVDEEGTEAAAVTSVGMALSAAAPEPEPFQMVVDRPFLCAIRDNATGLILFMGAVVDPE